MKNIMYLLCVVLLLSGCNDSKQKLTGKVTFSDGEPLTVGTVVFSTSSFMSRAAIKPDGTFKVGTYKAGDGIPPGTYKVSIFDAYASAEGSAGAALVSGMPLTPLVAKEFTSEATTPLSITIPGTKTFNIVVERAPVENTNRRENRPAP
jgi:hypothetical protein